MSALFTNTRSFVVTNSDRMRASSHYKLFAKFSEETLLCGYVLSRRGLLAADPCGPPIPRISRDFMHVRFYHYIEHHFDFTGFNFSLSINLGFSNFLHKNRISRILEFSEHDVPEQD